MDNSNSPEPQQVGGRSLKYKITLTVAALGIVFGDIGTSPLYAVRECFSGPHAVIPTHDNVLGVLSLIFWALILIISVKYLLIILRADNDGEGGILALMELVKPSKRKKYFFFVFTLGLFGAALLYGDGMITPAISVLSAVEGLKVATPFFEPFIIPITLIILFFLFFMQKRGTEKVGRIFGPIIMVWFITIAALGIGAITNNPEVFLSVNPQYAVNFFIENGFHGMFILGAVFLVVTGGEALYADLGHFGRFPIRAGWFTLVLPCLLLNYFGQGALVLTDPAASVNPFYLLAPGWMLYPLVILATTAAAIASQAVISGAFSLTFQALQLGYLPRMEILHTSESERGQIYIPQLNWMLFLATVALVLGFGSSSNIAAAYGIAVTTTMVITTTLAFIAMKNVWKWNLLLAASVTAFFLVAELSFWASNILKVLQGGWVPLLIAGVIYYAMTTWYKGRKKIKAEIEKQTESLEKFINEFLSIRVMSIPGTAIYLSKAPHKTPSTLLINIIHNKILHRQIVILTIIFNKVPRINLAERIEIEEPADNFYKVIANFGFMDQVNISDILIVLAEKGIKIDENKLTYFLGRETLILSKGTGLEKLRDRLFLFMYNNSQRATEYFRIPSDKVFEVGAQIKV